MALLHRATLTPTKIELLNAWVPAQPWAVGIDVGELEKVGAFRLDDPANVVGLETHLLRTRDDRVIQVPLTYRPAALDGGDAILLGTLQHSVLGERFVYDGCADPVYVATLAATILCGGREADEFVDSKDGPEPRPSTTFVRGSGDPGHTVSPVMVVSVEHDGRDTVIHADPVTLRVRRVVEFGSVKVPHDVETLVGRWPGHDEWALLASASNEVT